MSGVREPSKLLQVAEARAVAELAAFAVTAPIWRLAPSGDGHSVLVLPGFMASDRSTQILRTVLASRGYDVHGWALGTNTGPSVEVLDGIDRRLGQVFARTGRPVTVLGWSLGGIYARELARRSPGRVRQVITLGSPFRMTPDDRSSVSTLFEELNDLADGRLHALVPEPQRPPLQVPSTAIYSRTDGVVRWHTCIDEAGPRRENIEVRGSHCGLGWNLSALYATVDRLAQPPGLWAPFRAPLALRLQYPKPVSWSARAA